MGDIRVNVPTDLEFVKTSKIASQCIPGELEEKGGDIFEYDSTPVKLYQQGNKNWTEAELTEIDNKIASIRDNVIDAG